MVTLPEQFVAVKYPGYFLDINTREVYSIKIGGTLIKLKQQKGNRWNCGRDGYKVFVKGQRRWLDQRGYLDKIQPEDSVIPISTRM